MSGRAAARRGLLVRDPGPSTTVQDAGRPGHAHLGVPRSGWLDAAAARAANRLVGNAADHGDDPGCAVLETLGGGLVVEATDSLVVAVTGAACGVRVDGRPVAFAEPLVLGAGAVLEVGRPARGVRTWLAVAGGVVVEPVLGSRSTDTLSGLGPPSVTAGDLLPVGPAQGPPRTAHGLVASTPAGAAALRVRPGPRADWFVGGLEALTRSAYVVAAEADRVGVRLEGPRLERSRDDELPSEGLVVGAVQVPADGRPLVFLRDHPTTGGYPVVAVVDPRDLDRCAQLRPGDEVSFRRG